MMHIFKSFSFITIPLLLIGSVAFSDDLYNQGKYAEASLKWLGEPNKTWATYYNIGNSFYKAGQPGKAVAYFEKALSDAPRSEKSDIRHNLDLATQKLKDSGFHQDNLSFWYGKIVPFFKHGYTQIFGLLLLLCATSLNFFLISYFRKKQTLSWRAMGSPLPIGLICLTLLFSTVFFIGNFAQKTTLGAVISENIVAKSGPGDKFTDLFKLYPGTTIVITGEKQDNWFQVRFSIGNIGWVHEKDLLLY